LHGLLCGSSAFLLLFAIEAEALYTERRTGREMSAELKLISKSQI